MLGKRASAEWGIERTWSNHADALAHSRVSVHEPEGYAPPETRGRFVAAAGRDHTALEAARRCRNAQPHYGDGSCIGSGTRAAAMAMKADAQRVSL